MPILVQVPVDIPQQLAISYDFLQDELARYAKSVVESFDEDIEVMDAASLAEQTSSVEDVRRDMHAWIQEQFKSTVA